jgi:hypothetical protein
MINKKGTKYRQLPVEIEAYQWYAKIEQVGTPEWFIDAYKSGQIYLEYPEIHVKTSSGVQIVEPGDYVTKDGKGELSTCSRALFELTYRKVPTEEEVKKAIRRKRTMVFSVLGLLAWVTIGGAWSILSIGEGFSRWWSACFFLCAMVIEHGLIGYYWVV